ncbi:Na+-transporting methylmalonyl-CoA/oxaloacetate decarboxylase gamma subunit [Staphylococcus saprophyticus]
MILVIIILFILVYFASLTFEILNSFIKEWSK